MQWAALCSMVPVLAALVGLAPMRVRLRECLTVAAAVVCMVAAVALVVDDQLPIRGYGDYVYIDSLSVVLVLTVAMVYLCASVFAVGYFGYERQHRDFRVYNRRFHVLFNLFAASMFWVPFSGNLMLLWVAVEVTTVTSALLVALEHSRAAAEAAWKYILIASTGLILGLLGLTLLYFAAAAPLGTHFNPTFTAFLAGAPHMDPDTVRLAFALIVVGFGAKAGLVPMHTWLPDAHSEGATPVSAMLSGALLADAMYAIFRVYPIVTRVLGSAYPQVLLSIFGLASLLVAGLFALRQTNLKRLYAYSSIEHMGILSVGVAVSGPIALYGVMLHLVAHGVTKALAFFGAGSVLQRFRTKDARAVHGLSTLMPATAAFLVLGGLAISGLPPGALFRSEVMVLVGAFRQHSYLTAGILILFVNLVFLGILRLVNGMTFTQPQPDAERGESSRIMVVGMALAALPVLTLGFVIPGALDHVLAGAAAILGGAS
ncbi:MAG: proton-conducting transporter transmembrane domain-containing protein [Candidatus Dormibacteria bacterium]